MCGFFIQRKGLAGSLSDKGYSLRVYPGSPDQPCEANTRSQVTANLALRGTQGKDNEDENEDEDEDEDNATSVRRRTKRLEEDGGGSI